MTQKEMEKLSDRELLVKTFGNVEWLKGVMGNGGGVLEDIRELWKAQRHNVTRATFMLIIGVASVIYTGMGVFLYFLTRVK